MADTKTASRRLHRRWAKLQAARRTRTVRVRMPPQILHTLGRTAADMGISPEAVIRAGVAALAALRDETSQLSRFFDPEGDEP